MPFLLNEDAALKTLLTGITVADSGNDARPVGVFYGQPDKEIRQQSYPYITIDLVSVTEDVNRAHRGYVPLTYTPEGVNTTNINICICFFSFIFFCFFLYLLYFFILILLNIIYILNSRKIWTRNRDLCSF